MSIKGLFWRFSCIYFLVLIAFFGMSIGAILLAGNLFGTKPLDSFLSDSFIVYLRNFLNLFIIGLPVYWASLSFGKKNGRFFSKSEKRVVVFGCIGISYVVWFLLSGIYLLIFHPSLLYYSFTNFLSLFSEFIKRELQPFVLETAIYIVIGLVAAYLAVFLAKKHLLKNKLIQPQ